MGHKRGAHQPTRGGAPPYGMWPNWRRKKGGSPPFLSLFPLPFFSGGKRKGGRHLGKPQVGFGSYLGHPLAAYPPLPPIYMWGGGT